jgi:hypothetical protein
MYSRIAWIILLYSLLSITCNVPSKCCSIALATDFAWLNLLCTKADILLLFYLRRCILISRCLATYACKSGGLSHRIGCSSLSFVTITGTYQLWFPRPRDGICVVVFNILHFTTKHFISFGGGGTFLSISSCLVY